MWPFRHYLVVPLLLVMLSVNTVAVDLLLREHWTHSDSTSDLKALRGIRQQQDKAEQQNQLKEEDKAQHQHQQQQQQQQQRQLGE